MSTTIKTPNIWNTLSVKERRRIQHQIRTHYQAKTPEHPFLGVDMINVNKNDAQIRMTQEQYATLWLKSSKEIRHVGR